MAHMYPRVFPRENESGGEKRVFEYFKENAPQNWYILHSFRLPKHLKVVFGESDFIVVAPGVGIFTLEIKSGGVGFDGTHWQFINRDHMVTKKQRGPFQQAREGIFEVERIINSKTNDKYPRTQYLYGYGVIFTDEDSFPVSSITEDESWRLMQRQGPQDYCAFVRKLATQFKRELSELGWRIPNAPTEEQAAEIVSILRPEIECMAPLKSFVDYSEEDIIKATEEQFNCLEDIAANDRMVVLGGAGTGKTVLAIKDIERTSEECDRIGVFCFNKNLAALIKRSISAPNADVWSFHAFLTKICGDSILKEDTLYNKEYFEETLPKKAVEVLKQKPLKYSKIIVDEFQDLCTKNYLAVFNELLEGELFDGRFTFFGDFARQAIFGKDVSLDVLSNYTYFSKKMLTVNCRNTKNIGNELVNVTGYSDPKYRLGITGEPVDYFSWKEPEEEFGILKKILNDLKRKEFKSSDITILSPKKREDSVMKYYDPGKDIIGDVGDDPNSYRAIFSTVQAFKGLESKVVIVTDIEHYNDTQLMYVALSRARSKMYVLESESASKQRRNNTVLR